MSHSPPNYMENVPVKISEQYKPPPKVSLPQSVIQKLNTTEIPSPLLDYDFSLEENVIKKMVEWRKYRETESETRRERNRIREIQRMKQIEEKQKILLTAVSYPNAEDLSSDDEDGGAEDDDAESPLSIHSITTPNNKSIVQCSPSQKCFDTILTPTIVPDASASSFNPINSSNNIKKINYSDFENDTSSPFDNIELKTINDLRILGEVFKIHSTGTSEDDSHTESTESNNQVACTSNLNTIDNSQAMVQQQQQTNMYAPSSSQNANHLYAYNQAIQNNVNMNGIAKQDYYYIQNNQNYDNYMYSNINYSVNPAVASTTTIHSTGQFNYPLEYISTTNVDYFNDTAGTTIGVQNAKNKSKSVPDILKELNDEVRDSEMRRQRNHSQTIQDSEKNKVNNAIDSNNKKPEVDEFFQQLSPSSQILAKKISVMGFPLEQVSRVAKLFDNDDKKILDHLIVLNELIEYGFEESRISEALIKFDNNKEKALDFLVS